MRRVSVEHVWRGFRNANIVIIGRGCVYWVANYISQSSVVFDFSPLNPSIRTSQPLPIKAAHKKSNTFFIRPENKLEKCQPK